MPAMMLPTPPCSSAAAMSRSRQKASREAERSWFGRSLSANTRLPAALPVPGCGTGPKSVNPVSGSGSVAKAAPSTEMAICSGRISRGHGGEPEAVLDIALVDYTGAVSEGRLLRGDTPVLMTVEVVLEARG
jgi:hypothetical protein